jgi:hypothetical protein
MPRSMSWTQFKRCVSAWAFQQIKHQLQLSGVLTRNERSWIRSQTYWRCQTLYHCLSWRVRSGLSVLRLVTAKNYNTTEFWRLGHGRGSHLLPPERDAVLPNFGDRKYSANTSVVSLTFGYVSREMLTSDGLMRLKTAKYRTVTFASHAPTRPLRV